MASLPLAPADRSKRAWLILGRVKADLGSCNQFGSGWGLASLAIIYHCIAYNIYCTYIHIYIYTFFYVNRKHLAVDKHQKDAVQALAVPPCFALETLADSPPDPGIVFWWLFNRCRRNGTNCKPNVPRMCRFVIQPANVHCSTGSIWVLHVYEMRWELNELNTLLLMQLVFHFRSPVRHRRSETWRKISGNCGEDWGLAGLEWPCIQQSGHMSHDAIT